MRIAGISGSLRRGSYNTALLRAAVDLAPEGVTIDAYTLHGVPLYDADVETAEGIPPAAQALKDAVAQADALLLVTPEYNNGIPGVFKNGIDWMSRPPADAGRVFAGKPTALIGASPGNWGTILSQNAWLATLHTLGCSTWNGGRLMIPTAHKVFGEDGALVDEAVKARLAKFLEGFAAFVGR